MIPVSQTIHSLPGGNCFQACVASIFELSLGDVPHFFRDSTGNDLWTQSQWDEVREFATSQNTRAFYLDPDSPDDHQFIEKLEESGLHYVAFGPSRLNSKWGHCVVMEGGYFRHDPGGQGHLAGPPWLYVGFESVPQATCYPTVPNQSNHAKKEQRQ